MSTPSIRRCVFNPSPINDQIKAYPLEYVDYLILNEIEAQQICEVKAQELEENPKRLENRDRILEKIGHIEGIKQEEITQAISLLTAYLPKAKIVLTLGGAGSIYVDEEGVLFQKAYNVEVVDTTAAGDTFTGFFIGNLAQEKGVSQAMELATKAAAISVTRKGAGPSIPSQQEVLDFKH